MIERVKNLCIENYVRKFRNPQRGTVVDSHDSLGFCAGTDTVLFRNRLAKPELAPFLGILALQVRFAKNLAHLRLDFTCIDRFGLIVGNRAGVGFILAGPENRGRQGCHKTEREFV